MMKLRRLLFTLALGTGAVSLAPLMVPAQQVPDRAYKPPISRPSYSQGVGPTVCVDEAHHNFHTLAERFWAFGELLRRDGYVTRPLHSRLNSSALTECAILVISNAQPSDAPWEAYPYPTPSAFTPDEIEVTREWVRRGGRLLLIADHMPFAGAASALADAFGIVFTDGFALEAFTTEAEREASLARPTIFRTSNESLRARQVLVGRDPSEAVDSIRTFTGQAFRAAGAAQPVLVLPSDFVSLMPKVAWEFLPDTPALPVGGWLQGAVLELERGKAAFFGEAAMFTAQVTGGQRSPMGMNALGAEENFQFVLNLIRWLTRPVQ